MSYPARFEVDAPERVDNWRPLVQWLLVIPHVIVLSFLGIAGTVIAVLSWFTIVFTGALSSSLADTQAMIMRYSARVTAYGGFLHQQYPPFDFTSTSSEPGGTPVTVEFDTALEDRDRLTAGLRFIWVIPAAIFAAIIVLVAEIVWLIAAFAVLFTGSWPPGMRDFVVKAIRLNTQVNAYALLLTDEYPPFALTD